MRKVKTARHHRKVNAQNLMEGDVLMGNREILSVDRKPFQLDGMPIKLIVRENGKRQPLTLKHGQTLLVEH